MLLKQLKINSNRKYPPELRSFALTLNFYSPSAYYYVRKTFGNCLPHPATLRKWYSSVDGAPGFTAESFRAVQIKVDEMKQNNKSLICSLIIDEMSIREHVQWNGKRHQGYVNFGTGTDLHDSLPRAKDVLVFLLVALNCRWKIPIGYFLINGLSASNKASLINMSISQIYQTGAVIKSITFDGASTNISAANILGARLSWPNIKPYILHPETGDKIYILLDPCHMIKLCRNTLGDWGVIYDSEGHPIEWKYFTHLVVLQEEAGLHAATKIRKRHINYQNEKMKVKLAVQTFSESVADAIEYCNLDLRLKEFENSQATVLFCRNINNIFDILNTRNMLSKKQYKQPLSSKNITFMRTFINNSINYLSSLLDNRNSRNILLSPRKTGFLGLIICLKSIEMLYNDLAKPDLIKFLLTYKLSQDHIEMFFSSIRAKGGFNNNPSAAQFEAAYKRLLVHIELTSTGTNCVAQDNTSILQVSSSNSSSSSQLLDDLFANSGDSEWNNDGIIDVNIDFGKNAFYIGDVVAYIGGFVVKKILNSINCNHCAKELTSDTSESLLLLRKNRGGLKKPSVDVIKICKVAENTFRQHRNLTDNNVLIKLVTRAQLQLNGLQLFANLEEHFLEQDPLSNHFLQLIRSILETYFILRIHHSHNTQNEIKSRIRNANTKIIHFKHQ